jgi:hypothetical protein
MSQEKKETQGIPAPVKRKKKRDNNNKSPALPTLNLQQLTDCRIFQALLEETNSSKSPPVGCILFAFNNDSH